MFPYSHMTLDELALRAETEDNRLALAMLSHHRDMVDSLYTQEQVDKLREEMGDEADAEEDRADSAERALEDAEEKIRRALDNIPAKTSHKGLVAIREILGAK